MATTAATLHTATRGPRARPRLPGAGNIFRKELREWFRTRRFLVTAVIATLVMAVIPVGVWIVDHDGLTAGRATLVGPEATDARGTGAGTLLTLSSYLAIVLTTGMLVKEREAGTAQWVFTKPVSRVGYGLAKWAANSLGVVLSAVVVPWTIAFGLLTAMYEVPDWSWTDQILAAGLAVVHAAIVVGLMLALGTLFRSTVPVAVVALGLSVAPMFLSPLIADGVLRLYPVFRLGDLLSDVANGRPVGPGDLAPLVCGLVFLPLSLAFAGRRLTREQLQ
jgi:ABC-2 type transport system permease protein